MKKLLVILIASFSYGAHAQVVSHFVWSASPLTKAAVGPDGSSISTSAYTATVPAPVNYAINPGTPTKDIDLTLTGSPYFDIPGIDIDLYFRREESEASFFKRGSIFNFGMLNGQLSVNFVTSKGSDPALVAVNSGNVFAVPDDHAFHHYRFLYDNNTGVGRIYVDEAVVYTYVGVAGYPLNWTNAGNVVIGSKMDATGRNLPVLGNFTVQNPALAATLPVSLLSFTASVKSGSAVLDWTTTKELNTEGFTVESSVDGFTFNAVTTVAASGSYELVHRYQAIDRKAHEGVVYYRLKMVDNDGKFSVSEVRKVSFAAGITTRIGCFPNPATDHVTVSISNAKSGNYRCIVMTLSGSIIKAEAVRVNDGVQQIRIDFAQPITPGTLLIKVDNADASESYAFKVIKA